MENTPPQRPESSDGHDSPYEERGSAPWQERINSTLQDLVDQMKEHGEQLRCFTSKTDGHDEQLQEHGRGLKVQKRYLELCFEDLHNSHATVLHEVTELRQEISVRFDGLDERLQAERANRGATRLHNVIKPTKRWDGESLPDSLLAYFPKRVYNFLRLVQLENHHKLAALLEFYGDDSWPFWGLLSIPTDGEISDFDSLLVTPHESLLAAIAHSPSAAEHELAIHLSLDYDKIKQDQEKLDRMRQEQPTTYTKRKTTEEAESFRKMKPEIRLPEVREKHNILQSNQEQRRSPQHQGQFSEGELGWDTRPSEERTPSSVRFPNRRKFRDASFSPITVASSARSNSELSDT